ncbi:rifin PIR protein,putative [Plasmodium sp. DRC-Itaito]|nr:rifin PIR protein,putative [Plasmodium sp. DRC-Itaito]
MKVHYINILLFAHALNILVNTHKKTSITQPTPKISTTRLLCECELYEPVNYDNDPQMKAVMQQFQDRTSERLRDYDDRMKTTRQKCKDRCDKESQKIILKDKLEKELMDKFATLDTDIQSDAIPTCVCEKSIADKVEKGCLRCGGVLGGGVAPGVGLLGGIGQVALSAWKPTAIADAIAEAIKLNADRILAAAIKAGAEAGKNSVIAGIENLGVSSLGDKTLKTFFTAKNYTDVPRITGYIYSEFNKTCLNPESGHNLLCFLVNNAASSGRKPVSAMNVIAANVNKAVTQAEGVAAKATEATRESAINAIRTEQTALIEGGFNSTTTSIYVSIIAIVVIVLIMIIIYLILRYRRKKKMKKKLQYIKLLEE